MLHIEHLTASVGTKKILNNVSFRFEKNKVYALVGPNGSGKSTLAMAVIGHPAYTLSKQSRILLYGEDMTSLPTYKRIKKGLFSTFQSPVALSGVNVFQVLRVALEEKYDPFTLRKKLDVYAGTLNISEDLLSRPLNEGFSGGERKKMEILQVLLIQPDVIFFDEIDTGVDADSLKVIATSIKKLKKAGKIIIFITHSNRILKLIPPDKVVVMHKGSIIKTGDAGIIHTIEKNGYKDYIKTKNAEKI